MKMFKFLISTLVLMVMCSSALTVNASNTTVSGDVYGGNTAKSNNEDSITSSDDLTYGFVDIALPDGALEENGGLFITATGGNAIDRTALDAAYTSGEIKKRIKNTLKSLKYSNLTPKEVLEVQTVLESTLSDYKVEYEIILQEINPDIAAGTAVMRKIAPLTNKIMGIFLAFILFFLSVSTLADLIILAFPNTTRKAAKDEKVSFLSTAGHFAAKASVTSFGSSDDKKNTAGKFGQVYWIYFQARSTHLAMAIICISVFIGNKIATLAISGASFIDNILSIFI